MKMGRSDFHSLPICLQDQCERLKLYFHQSKYEIWDSRDKYSCFYLIDNIKPFDLICYDNYGYWIRFIKIISKGQHVRLILGSFKDRYEMVIKYYLSGRKNIMKEILIYQKLKSLSCSIPFFISDFKFWNSSVLILEKLEPIDLFDNPYDVGISIIKQLVTMHKIFIHNDIKPDNIMKKYSKEKIKYFLIDYGGVATEKLDYGYRRILWSPRWTCQERGVSNQITTPKHDLIELGYTMKALLNLKEIGQFGEPKNIQFNFTGCLAYYMKFVENINKRRIRKEDYFQCIEILKDGKYFDNKNGSF